MHKPAHCLARLHAHVGGPTENLSASKRSLSASRSTASCSSPKVLTQLAAPHDAVRTWQPHPACSLWRSNASAPLQPPWQCPVTSRATFSVMCRAGRPRRAHLESNGANCLGQAHDHLPQLGVIRGLCQELLQCVADLPRMHIDLCKDRPFMDAARTIV